MYGGEDHSDNIGPSVVWVEVIAVDKESVDMGEGAKYEPLLDEVKVVG